MRNAQLTAELRASIDELRASRRRLVEAQDAERRKIERNLHDGAQQQLIALAIQLGLLAEAADDPGLVRQAIPELKAQLSAALDDLRALARGIYPPLLAEQGLVVALRAQVSRSPVPVVLEADEVGRYSPDAESTVYFCALGALQNVAKHARATRAVIRLAGNGDGLEFSVTDDGAGIPAGGLRSGSGLQGMTDRLAAHGGTLDVGPSRVREPRSAGGSRWRQCVGRGPGPGGGVIAVWSAASTRPLSRLSDPRAGEACVPRGRARVPACAGWRRAGGRRRASAGVPRAGRR